jgi:hypothetical protein
MEASSINFVIDRKRKESSQSDKPIDHKKIKVPNISICHDVIPISSKDETVDESIIEAAGKHNII